MISCLQSCLLQLCAALLAMDALKNKLKDLGLNIDTLDANDVNELKEGGTLDAKEASLLKVYVGKKQKPPKALPYPDLPPGSTPTFHQMVEFQSSAPALPTPKEGDDSAPINWNELSPADWMSIFFNCNLSRGLHSNTMDTAPEHLITPPNESLCPRYVAPSQFAMTYNSQAVKDTSYLDIAKKVDTHAFAKASSPWVSASTRFSMSQEEQTLSKKETCVTITKQIFAVCKFAVVPHEHIKIDDGDRGMFSVNPRFIAIMKDLLKQPTITAADLEDKVYRIFGDVFVSEATIGSARYTWKDFTSTKAQSYKSASMEFEASVKGGFGGYGGEAGGGHNAASREAAGESNTTSAVAWHTLGGGISDDAVKFRRDPQHWRVIHYSGVLSVMDLLPKEMQTEFQHKFRLPCGMSVSEVLPLNGQFRIKSFDHRYLYRPHGHWYRGEVNRLMVLLWNGDQELEDKHTWTIQALPADNPDRNKHYIISHDGYHIYRPHGYWHRGDERRLSALMWKEILKMPGLEREWTFEHVKGNTYYIKSHDGFYLYRPANYWYLEDEKRIQAFIWKEHIESKDAKFEWTLERVA